MRLIWLPASEDHTVCSGAAYHAFLDYAFEKTDYFMLVYINYFGKGYTKKQKLFKTLLDKYKVKSRTNPSWPGTPWTDRGEKTTYKIVFYRTDEEAKTILKKADALSDWGPGAPEDLAFFKGDRCWFFSTGHEGLATVVHADASDLTFLEAHGIASGEDVFESDDPWYDELDEEIEKQKKENTTDT